MKTKIRSKIVRSFVVALATTVLGLGLSAPGNAARVIVSVDLNSGSFPAPTGMNSSSAFEDSAAPMPDPPFEVSASTNTGFETTATVWIGKAFATADPFFRTQGVRTALDLSDFDESINGQINQLASARYSESFNVVGGGGSPDTFFLSPIFQLDGELQASPGVPARLLMNMELINVTTGVNQVVTLITRSAPADGSTLIVNELIDTSVLGVGSSDVVFMRLSLSVNIESFSVSALAAGDYIALLDFASTSTFLGFAVWEDEAMTISIPASSGIGIHTEDGDPIPVIDPDSPDDDSDGDGVPDVDDAFPMDASESSDNDGDGIGDNADTDDDNDMQSDEDEIACGSDPLDAASLSADGDGDSIPDCADPDDDNDGADDGIDVCPATTEAAPTSSLGLNKNRWVLEAINGEFTGNFMQAPPQEGSVWNFTTTETRGCSCSQIVAEADLGRAHLSRGCTTSAILGWIN
jgi:hypothetical protein